jgi:hypothetical protein
MRCFNRGKGGLPAPCRALMAGLAAWLFFPAGCAPSEPLQPVLSIFRGTTALKPGDERYDFSDTERQVVFTIKNTGAGPLVLTGGPPISVGGQDAREFTVIGEPSSPVPSGGSTRFTLVFKPANCRPKTALVTVRSNDPAAESFSFNVHSNPGDPVELDIGDCSEYLGNYALARNDAGYGVVWEIGGRLFFVRLTPCGKKASGAVAVADSAPTPESPSLVWTGVEYGLAWTVVRNREKLILFTRLDPEGKKKGKETVVSAVHKAPHDYSFVRYPLVWSERGYGLAWTDSRDGGGDIYFTRLDPDGSRTGKETRVTAGADCAQSPALAWTGTEYGLVWYGKGIEKNGLYFSRLAATGEKQGEDAFLSSASNLSEAPRLVWTGTEFGLSWVDELNDEAEIYFTRMDARGGLKQPAVRTIRSTVASTCLAWTGTAYALAWAVAREETGEIRFTLIDPAGRERENRLLASEKGLSLFEPSLACAGSECGLSWMSLWIQPGGEHACMRLHFIVIDERSPARGMAGN